MMTFWTDRLPAGAKGLEAEGRRTTSSSGSLRGAASDTKGTCQRYRHADGPTILALISEDYDLPLATDNKGAQYRPFLLVGCGAEGWQRMRFEGLN